MRFHLALIHQRGIVVHEGNFLLVAVDVFYKRRFDVLCERMACGSFLCHSLTCASRCEVTCGDRVTLGASTCFCADKTGSLSVESQERGHGLASSGRKDVSPHAFLEARVWREPPPPASCARELDLW